MYSAALFCIMYLLFTTLYLPKIPPPTFFSSYNIAKFIFHFFFKVSCLVTHLVSCSVLGIIILKRCYRVATRSPLNANKSLLYLSLFLPAVLFPTVIPTSRFCLSFLLTAPYIPLLCICLFFLPVVSFSTFVF